MKKQVRKERNEILIFNFILDPHMKMVVNGEEMMFLCNAFVPPESVPAIDYMVLTLSQATANLNDSQLLSSRMNISKKKSYC